MALTLRIRTVWNGIVIVGSGWLLGANCVPGPPATPVGDAGRGAILFATGDGTGPGCQTCHCPDGAGGCQINAPNIQGETYADIDARTRDPGVPHPGGKYDWSDQDVADIEAFLAEQANS